MRDGGVDNSALGVGIFNTLGRKLGELPVLEHYDVTRRVDHRNDVGGQIGAVSPHAHNDGRVLTRHGDHVRLVRADRGKAIGAHHVRACFAHGSHQIMRGGIAFLNQVSKNLGIGLTPKGMSAFRQLLSQLGKILDNAVVDNSDTPIAAYVRMGVLDRWASMRRPARMTDTTGRGRVMLF